MSTERTLQEKIALQVWATTPDNFNAEARLGTPYQTDEDTLEDIARIITTETGALNRELARTKLSLEYNASLSVRFMMALNHISQLNPNVALSDNYINLNEAISIAKEALKTQSFEAFCNQSNNPNEIQPKP